MALTPKQELFVNEYLKHFNATKAAIDAGYSPKTAYNIGWENVRKREVAEVISQRLSGTVMSPDEALTGLSDHARADIGRWLSDDGAVDIAAMKRDGATKNIKKVKRTERSGVNKDGSEWSVVTGEVELYDALAAKQLIVRHHGLLNDKMDLNVSGTLGYTADERAQADKETEEWKQKKAAEISNG